MVGVARSALLLALLAAGCGHPQVRLLEQGKLVEACKAQPFYQWYEAHSRRFSDALVAKTDMRLRLSPLTDEELEAAAAGKVPGEGVRKVVRLELDVRDLGPAVSVAVELPVIFRGHRYSLDLQPWNPKSVAALLPPLPELKLAELPRFVPGKAPERPTGVAAPHKAVRGVVQGFTMGLVKMRGRGPTRKELRRWRKAMKKYEAAEAKRRAAHQEDLAHASRVASDRASAHHAETRVREALVARLVEALAASCPQREAGRGKLRFTKPGRCVLHAALVTERDANVRPATIPDQATLRFKPKLQLAQESERCEYAREFKLKLPAGSDVRRALNQAFAGKPIRLQDLPPDPPPFD